MKKTSKILAATIASALALAATACHSPDPDAQPGGPGDPNEGKPSQH